MSFLKMVLASIAPNFAKLHTYLEIFILMYKSFVIILNSFKG